MIPSAARLALVPALFLPLLLPAAPLAAGVPAGSQMVRTATAWLDTLAPEQKARALRPYDDAARTGWHFIPKFERKGLSLREMVPAQQQQAYDLLRAALSQAGYDKSRAIMRLDEMLRLQEGAKARNIRDAERYFFTLFGTPAETGTWALSVEGHHLSLNFVVRDGRVVDSTPQFFGANPAEVRRRFADLPEPGFRVLGDEEQLAFDLVRSLSDEQRGRATAARRRGPRRHPRRRRAAVAARGPARHPPRRPHRRAARDPRADRAHLLRRDARRGGGRAPGTARRRRGGMGCHPLRLGGAHRPGQRPLLRHRWADVRDRVLQRPARRRGQSRQPHPLRVARPDGGFRPSRRAVTMTARGGGAA